MREAVVKLIMCNDQVSQILILHEDVSNEVDSHCR